MGVISPFESGCSYKKPSWIKEHSFPIGCLGVMFISVGFLIWDVFINQCGGLC